MSFDFTDPAELFLKNTDGSFTTALHFIHLYVELVPVSFSFIRRLSQNHDVQIQLLNLLISKGPWSRVEEEEEKPPQGQLITCIACSP